MESKKVLRLASVYGKNFKSFINKLLKFKKKGFYPLPIGIENKKSFLYYKDLLLFVQSALELKDSKIYNLAHPEELGYKDVVEVLDEVIKNLSVPIPIPKIVFQAEKFLRRFAGTKKDPILKPLFQSVLMDMDESIKNIGIHPQYNLLKGLMDMGV